MLNDNKITNLRSEAARAGYFDLPMSPVMHHAKGAIKKSYIDEKETTEKKIKTYKSLIESFSQRLTETKERLKSFTIDTVEIICTTILVLSITSLLLLWKEQLLIPISNESLIPIGFLIAGATLGGIYTVVRKKQNKDIKKTVMMGIVGFVVIITFLFSLQSSDPIHILKSAVIAGFVGLIVYITNHVLLPTCKGTFKSIIYAKDIILSIGNNISIIIVKQALNRMFSKFKNLHRKMSQEINEIESLLIIEFMLGQKANKNKKEIEEEEIEKEKYYA